MNRLPLLIIVALISSAFLVSLIDKPDAVKFVNFLLENSYTDDTYKRAAENSLELVIAAEASERSFQVNRPLKKGAINVYLVKLPNDTNLPVSLQKFAGQIAYVGESGIVLIDLSKIESLAKPLEAKRSTISSHSGQVLHDTNNPFDKGDSYADYHELVFRFVLTWVVGHEAGHILANHDASHFEESVITPNQFSPEAVKREHEADAVFAKGIQNAVKAGYWEVEDQQEFSELLVAYMEAQYLREIGDVSMHGPWAFLSHVPNKASTATTHAEFFIRAGRMLTLFDHSFTDMFQELVPGIEAQYYARGIDDGGKISVTGSPAHATVGMHSGRLTIPFDTWVPPDKYQLTVSAPGFLSETRNITVEAASINKLHVDLIKIPDYPHWAERTHDKLDIALTHYFRAETFVDSWNDQSNFKAASFELKQAIANNPEWANPHFALGIIALEENRCVDAMKHWRKGNTKFITRNNREYHIAFSAEPALALLDYDLRQNPTSSRISIEILQWHIDKFDFISALDFISKYLDKNDSKRLELYFLSLQHWSDGNLTKASQGLESLLREGLDIAYKGTKLVPTIENELALLFEQMGNLTRARELYENDHVELFRFYLRHNSFLDAENLISEIVADEDTVLTAPLLYCEITTRMFQAKQPLNAISMLTENNLIENSTSEMASCVTAAGNWHLSQNRVNEALEYCTLGEDLSDDGDDDHLDALHCLAQLPNQSEIKNLLREKRLGLLWNNPLENSFLSNQAELYSELGKFQTSACYRSLADTASE